METILVVLLLTGICQVMTAPNPNAQLEDYLYQYGYLPATDRRDDGPGMKRSQKDLEQATMRLQKFMGLEMTGQLDEPTQELMGKPRCGMPDMVVKDDGLQGVVEVNDDGPSNYTLGHGKWSQSSMPIKYGFRNLSPDLPGSTVVSKIDAAIKTWTDASSKLSCKKVADKSEEIQISFFDTDTHGNCHLRFGRALAHAMFPDYTNRGQVHFNEIYRFTSGTGAEYDLLFVAIHEFGHTFGVSHTNTRDAIMYPVYSTPPMSKLRDDDLAAIRALYGA